MTSPTLSMFMSIWILLKERADTMANELAVVKNFEIIPVDEDILQAFKEEMEGLGTLPIDTIKIPSGGGVAFEVPSDDPESPDMAKELVGVIVGHRPQNTYWANAYSGENSTPDCYSNDSKIGIISSTGETRNCKTCLYNQFGSGVNAQGQPTRGKACKNLHRLYFLLEGALMPVIINIPPTSIKSLSDYLSKRLLMKGKRSFQVLTKITLKKATSGDGIQYSQCIFTKVGDLSPEVQKNLAPVIALTKELMNTRQDVQANATTPSEPTNNAFDGKTVHNADMPEFEDIAD